MDIISRIFNRKSKNRKERVKIEHFHKIKLFIFEKEYEIENISITGIGFINSDNDKNLKKNKTIHAVVHVLDKLCDIELDIRHCSGSRIGCKVISACEIYRKYVEDYFKSELEGMKLRKIGNESVKVDKAGIPHWYYGDYNHEIYFTTKEQKISSFQINYHGQMVIYDGKVVSTGVVWEDDKEEISHKSSDLIKPSDKLSKEIMEYVFRFVEVASEIDKSYKDQILNLIDEKFKKDWLKK